MKLSIIVPVYNAEKTIKHCLQSISSQTFKDFECIIVNDGSNDNSLEICNSFVLIDHRFKVISQNNSGVSVSRNNGIRNSNGEWVTFVDSDDFLDETMYEDMFSRVNNNIDIVVCGFRYLLPDKIINTSKKEKCIVLNRYQSINYIKKKSWVGGGPWNKIYRRSCIGDTLFEECLKFGEDTVFLIDVFMQARKILFFSKALYNYVQYSGSLSHTYSRHIVDYAYFLLNKYKHNSFLAKYSKATICYIEYFYAKNNGQSIYNKIYNYIPFFLTTSGFPVKTRIYFISYIMFPFLHKFIRAL